MVSLKDRAAAQSATTKILTTLQTPGSIREGHLTPHARLELLRAIGEAGFSAQEVAEALVLADQKRGTEQGSIIAQLHQEVLGEYRAQPGWQKVIANLRNPLREVKPSTTWVEHLPPVPADAVVRDWEAVVTGSQRTLADTVNKGEIHRGFHAKTIFAEPGELTMYPSPAIPDGARVGFLAAGDDPNRAAVYKVAVRGSNGQGCPFLNDAAGDVRGLAVQGGDAMGGFTITATNQINGQHVPDAKGFIDFAKAITRSTAAGLSGLLNQLRSGFEIGKEFGAETPSVLARLTRDTLHPPDSLATETFVGSIVRLGDYVAKVVWVPAPDTAPGTQGAGRDPKKDPDYLAKDAQSRGAKKWVMCLQFYTNGKDTPLDDATHAWKSPLIPVGELKTKPARDPAARQRESAEISQLRFNPGDFDSGPAPLGREALKGPLPDAMGNVRKRLYDASANERGAQTLEASRAYIQNIDLAGR